MSRGVQQVAQQIVDDDGIDRSALATEVAAWPEQQRHGLIQRLLPHSNGRRWLRGFLLPQLLSGESVSLAHQLMSFEGDFAVDHRDSTTEQVVRALPLQDVIDSALFFAGSNAAGSFWQRVASDHSETIPTLASRIISSGNRAARETTLSILLLDPFSDVRLTGTGRLDVLLNALSDEDAGIRGIAADVLADEAPERLSQEFDRLVSDASERVRMAAWDAAFVSHFERARSRAFDVALDESGPLDARRTAVTALSAVLTTAEMVPLLEVLVLHPNQTLAEDAVNLLWTYHRNPVVATAASESPHESVREVAQRLLHPETGSPAAGGSRPGSPDAPRDIYHEMLKGYERRDE